MAEMSAGRAVVEVLKAEEVRHLFGIVGATFLDVLDVLYDDKSVEYVNVRHEQGAALMADGLARITGAPAVCLVTSGPGATNLLTGIAAAHVAHSPVVAIAGGPPLGHQYRDAFQEFDLVSLFKPVTKLSIQVTRPERIPELLRHALRTAMTGRKGPVFVEIPRDVLGGRVLRAEIAEPSSDRPAHPPPPHPQAVRDVVCCLAEAERPLLLVGGGVTWAGASDLVVRLSGEYALPVITAYGRNDAVPNAHPLYIGPLGRAGAPEAAAACRRADLLLVVGSRLGQFTSFYDERYIQPGTSIVQIDIDPRDIGRHYPVVVGIQADARETLAALLEALPRHRVLAAEPALLLHRGAGGNPDRRAARHRTTRDDCDAAPPHLQRLAGRGADHAGRHLLRRPVRRLDHRDPGEPPGRDLGGGHVHRRLPDGAAGTGRAGARDRGDRLVLRRHRVHAADRALRPAAGRGRAEVRRGGPRLAFGITELTDGIGFVVVAVGVFAVGEIVSNLGEAGERQVFTARVTNLLPTREDLRRSFGPIVRGTGIGAFFGVLPGTGPAIASFASYMVEKKLARDPSRFGRGAIEGVAGPESANNADAQCKFIPMLTLGLPASGVMALMLGALTIHGIAPGPQVMTQKPDLFWGLVASMWIGNLMLVVLNLPLIGLWVSLLRVPYRLLFPAIMVFSVIGVYSVNNSGFDVYLAAGFGVVGFVWMRLGCSPAPMLLGFVLGPMMEENLRRALVISRGDPSLFVTRPISLAFLVATALILIAVAAPAVRNRRVAITG